MFPLSSWSCSKNRKLNSYLHVPDTFRLWVVRELVTRVCRCGLLSRRHLQQTIFFIAFLNELERMAYTNGLMAEFSRTKREPEANSKNPDDNWHYYCQLYAKVLTVKKRMTHSRVPFQGKSCYGQHRRHCWYEILNLQYFTDFWLYVFSCACVYGLC